MQIFWKQQRESGTEENNVMINDIFFKFYLLINKQICGLITMNIMMMIMVKEHNDGQGVLKGKTYIQMEGG